LITGRTSLAGVHKSEGRRPSWKPSWRPSWRPIPTALPAGIVRGQVAGHSRNYERACEKAIVTIPAFGREGLPPNLRLPVGSLARTPGYGSATGRDESLLEESWRLRPKGRG
jgi:hypothetical protein